MRGAGNYVQPTGSSVIGEASVLENKTPARVRPRSAGDAINNDRFEHGRSQQAREPTAVGDGPRTEPSVVVAFFPGTAELFAPGDTSVMMDAYLAARFDRLSGLVAKPLAAGCSLVGGSLNS